MTDGYTTSENIPAFKDMSDYKTYNKILLIEDNPGDARLVELLLGESDLMNCQVVNKITLALGLEELEKNDDYAAILLDLTLPDSRGFETLENLLNRFPENNVIVLTGLSDKSLGVNAVKAGAQDFLIKGAFDADGLAKSLRYSIERSNVLKRLEETQRIARIGNWEYNSDADEFKASDEVYAIFGLNPKKRAVSGVDMIAANPQLQIFSTLHQETVNTPEKKIKKDIKLQRADGSTRYAFIQCVANKSTENNLVFSGIIQDITERKLAEQEMVKSQERYQEIFTKSKDAIYICDKKGGIIDFNESTTTLFGYPAEELKGVNIHNLFTPVASRFELIERLETKGAVKDFEIEIEQKSGDRKHCIITANYLEKEDFQGYNGIIRDITERKQAEELIKARDLARQSAQMKEQFIASISHEMRTPMNAVLGMSNLVIKTKLDDEQFNYISSIKQSSEILLGIINDILEISTLQNGKIDFEHKNFDLHELLGNLVNVMQYKFKEKDMVFEVEIAENVSRYIKGDKLRLNQVLYNLVGNGVKFTDNGHVKLRVQTLTENEGIVQLNFEVEDTGIGIPENKLGAVFETFTRIRNKNRIYEGTGLGLSISKNLIEQQGGKIGVRSVLGEGSTFFFDLVFEKGKSEEETSAKDDDYDKIEEVPFDGNIDLLLVEDHKMNQLVARKTLERQWPDINITIADNGQIAVNLLKEKKFDIILMDIQMPIMDGYEATQYIRNQMPDICNMPILAMTAHAHISKDEKFKEYGMDDFVLKPFEPKQLFNKIAKYVQRNNNTGE